MLTTLLHWLSRRPLPVSHRLGALAGRLTWWLSPSWRRKTRIHLAAAGLDTPAMRRGAARHAGMLAAETPGVWMKEIEDLAAFAPPPDWSAALAARAQGRGVLFCTPHLGGFEVAARLFALHAPITVLYKPPKREDLKAIVEGARPHRNMKTAPASLGGVRALLRALKNGEAVGILPDQVPGAGEGEWVPFFGRPAYTMTLPLRLAQSTGALVLLVACERVVGQGWRVHVETLDETPTPAALNAAMERLIRRFPEQYLWGYNRYKRPPGAPPAPGDAVAEARA